MSIGEVYECFIREVGSYMWRDIGFDKETWNDVSKAERVCMFQYLSTWFDFGAITNDPMTTTYWAPLNNQICAQYRGRKNVEKYRLTGSIGDVEAARAQAPTEKHQKRSVGNKKIRKKQVVKNREGTCSYDSACFKKNLNRFEAFHRAHVNKKDEFVDPLVEDKYGTRRGHVRGIGPKPFSVAGTSTSSQWQSQSQAPQPTQDVNVKTFLHNPTFVTAIRDIIRSFKNQVNNEENNDEEDENISLNLTEDTQTTMGLLFMPITVGRIHLHAPHLRPPSCPQCHHEFLLQQQENCNLNLCREIIAMQSTCHHEFLLQQQEKCNLNLYREIMAMKSTWSPPRYNLLKLNTDGSSKGNPGPSSIGGLIRDGNGRWLCGYIGKMKGRSYTSLEAEVWSISKGYV
ncbi:unnamed protein product [Lactuca saligna]|uniref:RNase H type-1 domain-containing protein n=1 Tax=Lactuca saligna TaxID=75948 RepID=A0AA36E3M1_LACSI|nr:unnamed protein product [Lactuca saligna]